MKNLVCFLGDFRVISRHFFFGFGFWELGSPPPHVGKNSQIVPYFILSVYRIMVVIAITIIRGALRNKLPLQIISLMQAGTTCRESSQSDLIQKFVFKVR